MEVGKGNTEENIETAREQYRESTIEELTRCCLCGSKLNFNHEIDYLSLQVHEKSNCPACQIELRARVFTLQ